MRHFKKWICITRRGHTAILWAFDWREARDQANCHLEIHGGVWKTMLLPDQETPL